MRVSIITPSFNQAGFIGETLASVACQSYWDIEHWVIDGGSTDGTLEVVKRFPHVRWLSERDEGQTHAINKGLERTTGGICTWLNSDDTYVDSEVITDVVRMLEEDPRVDVLYGDYLITDQRGAPIQLKREIPFDARVLLYGVNIIGQPASFFRRSVIGRSGYLDPSYQYLMDLEFWVRAARAGAHFRHVPRVFATYRWHSASKTVQLSQKLRDEWRQIQDRERRWRLPGVADVIMLRLLNLAYRIKRQWVKLMMGVVPDWYPTHFRLKRYKSRAGLNNRTGRRGEA